MAKRKLTPHLLDIVFSTLFSVTWLWIQLCINQVSSVSNPQWTRENEFCYDPNRACGPASWEGTCRTGGRQSPIDIPAPKIRIYKKWTFFTFNSAYASSQPSFYAGNNGHSFQMQFENGGINTNSDLIVGGAALPREYRFGQLHFHWGSEHTINGLRYPLELHIVHYSTKYSSLMDAINAEEDSTALAVFAVFFHIGPNNPALDTLVGIARRSTEAGEDFMFFRNHPINVADLLPKKKLSFTRYSGSLTTPPCTENVVWTVFNYPVSISMEQLEAFQGVRNGEAMLYMNFRPTQPQNGRSLEFYGAVPLREGNPLSRISKGGFLLQPSPILLPGLSRMVQVLGDFLQLLRARIMANSEMWVRAVENVFGFFLPSTFIPASFKQMHLLP